MSSSHSGLLERIRAGLVSIQTLVILVAIVVALPTAYLVSSFLDAFESGYFLLILLGVRVPQIYERREPLGDASPMLAVAWTVGACLLVAATFTAVSLAGLALGISPLVTAGGAFVLTYLAATVVVRILPR